jgi:aromatic ring-cleaving dioxygenase
MAEKNPGAGTVTPKNVAAIAEYHAHVYYDPAKTRGNAERLRARIAQEFPQAKLGRWHDEHVGPHPGSTYQVEFPAAMLASFVPWLMLNRDGLNVLLHPETGDGYLDHAIHAAWFGQSLPLKLEVFGERE